MCVFDYGSVCAQLTSTDINLMLKTTGSRLDLARYDDINGSPYLFAGWKNGTVNLNNKTPQPINNIRFNCYQNQLEYLLDEQIYTPMNRYNEFAFYNFNDKNIIVPQVFRNGLGEVSDTKTYFEVLHDGKTKLLQKYAIRVDEYAEPLSYRKLRRFIKVTNLYLYTPENRKLSKIKLDKKSILDVLNDKKESLNAYIDEHKLKLKSQDDVIELLKYYDR